MTDPDPKEHLPDRALFPDASEFLTRLDISQWCPGTDPVLREVVYNARTRELREHTNAEVEDFVARLEAQLSEGYAATERHRFQGVSDGVPCYDEPDSVDLLLLLYRHDRWGSEKTLDNLKALLALLCLSEARKGNCGLAVKAYCLATSEKGTRTLKAAEQGRRKGAKARKRREGIYLATLMIVRANPTISAEGAWRKFPDRPDHPDADNLADGYTVYRDGEKLYQEDETGRTKSMTLKRDSYDRYVADAKAELKKASQ
jgi:hypothetical protein